MVGEIAAAGDVIAGALAARAVEPHAGEHEDGAGGLCLNCGTRRIGAYCHACGQSGHIHRTIGAIGHELAHGVFHFEGKIWRTLPMLAFRPGELTRRYIQGERARFVSPLALYLFIIFVLFAFLSVIGAHMEAPALGSEANKAAHAGIERVIADRGETIADLGRQRATALKQGRSVAALDTRIAELNRDTTAMRTSLKVMEVQPGDDFGNVKTGWSRLDKGLRKAAENPNLLLYKLQSNAYKFAWALIPLSLPFMWLLFPFSRRYGFYDHAIFVTYSLCFVTLALLIPGLVGFRTMLGGLLLSVGLFAVPVHMYKQLRGTYGCGRIGAFLRMLLLMGFTGVTLILFLLLLIALGVLG